jgi:hypothetical protein
MKSFYAAATAAIKGLFRRSETETLLSLATRRQFQPKGNLANLYILEVEFPLDEETATKVDEALEPLRRKYDLDFYVKEPGFTFRRFYDI